MSYNIRNSDIEALLRLVAEFINRLLPEGWGFTLLLYNFGENKTKSDGMFYISNAERETMIAAMKEFIKKNEH